MAQGWQLSYNRRWRLSTWQGQLVQQPFTRAYLMPIEDPFDPADNAAKSLGCEVRAEAAPATHACEGQSCCKGTAFLCKPLADMSGSNAVERGSVG